MKKSKNKQQPTPDRRAYFVRCAIQELIERYNAHPGTERQLYPNDILVDEFSDQAGAWGCFFSKREDSWFLYTVVDDRNLAVNGPFSDDGIVVALSKVKKIPEELLCGKTFSRNEEEIFREGMKPNECYRHAEYYQDIFQEPSFLKPVLTEWEEKALRSIDFIRCGETKLSYQFIEVSEDTLTVKIEDIVYECRLVERAWAFGGEISEAQKWIINGEVYYFGFYEFWRSRLSTLYTKFEDVYQHMIHFGDVGNSKYAHCYLKYLGTAFTSNYDVIPYILTAIKHGMEFEYNVEKHYHYCK